MATYGFGGFEQDAPLRIGENFGPKPTAPAASIVPYTDPLLAPGYPVYPSTALVQSPPAPAVPAPATPAPFAGSSLNTLYGVDSESFLTDDQRKLARQIQGKFDSSMNRRDRALAQYGAPRLSSFVEDEALARAMSLARGLNYGAPDPFTGARAGSGGAGAAGRAPTGGGGGGGGSSRPGALTRAVPGLRTPAPGGGGATPSNAARLQQILSGLTSLAPLLFGKDAMGQFMNKGLLGTLKDAIFGKELGPMINDQALEQMVRTGALPDAGGFEVNPFTGMPIAPSPFAPPSIYGPGSGWGDDVIQQPSVIEYGPGSEPGWGGGAWTEPPAIEPGWGGGDYWEDPNWWDMGGGGWEDPFGIGGW